MILKIFLYFYKKNIFIYFIYNILNVFKGTFIIHLASKYILLIYIYKLSQF